MKPIKEWKLPINIYLNFKTLIHILKWKKKYIFSWVIFCCTYYDFAKRFQFIQNVYFLIGKSSTCVFSPATILRSQAKWGTKLEECDRETSEETLEKAEVSKKMQRPRRLGKELEFKWKKRQDTNEQDWRLPWLEVSWLLYFRQTKKDCAGHTGNSWVIRRGRKNHGGASVLAGNSRRVWCSISESSFAVFWEVIYMFESLALPGFQKGLRACAASGVVGGLDTAILWAFLNRGRKFIKGNRGCDLVKAVKGRERRQI